MRKPDLIAGAFLAVAALASGLWSAIAQEASSNGVAVHVVVTVEPRHGSNVPVINREDVMVYQGHDRAKVTDWLPLQGEHAGLQLFILIDEAASAICPPGWVEIPNKHPHDISQARDPSVERIH